MRWPWYFSKFRKNHSSSILIRLEDLEALVLWLPSLWPWSCPEPLPHKNLSALALLFVLSRAVTLVHYVNLLWFSFERCHLLLRIYTCARGGHDLLLTRRWTSLDTSSMTASINVEFDKLDEVQFYKSSVNSCSDLEKVPADWGQRWSLLVRLGRIGREVCQSKDNSMWKAAICNVIL